MILKDIPTIKQLIVIALSQVDKQKKALLLKHAFFATVRIIDIIKAKEVLPEHLNYLNGISDRTNYKGKCSISEKESEEWEKFIKRSYPQLAQALDTGSAILNLIEDKRLYKYYGCKTIDEWEFATDDNGYIVKALSDLADFEARGYLR